MDGLFITGVGTGVGKTLVMTILCRQLRAVGVSVVALKPVVSGFEPDDTASDPVLILKSLGITPTPEAIAWISPWRFAAPISPHLAARREGRTVRLEEIFDFFSARSDDSEFDHMTTETICLIEGAGGVMSPLCEDGTCLDLIACLGHPAVLVTGTYLGSLSHTLTALVALRERDIPVRGIVVSESIDTVGLDETIESLREYGAGDIPIDRLPRLTPDAAEPWHDAPSLLGLYEDDDE